VGVFRYADPAPGAWQEFLAAMRSGEVFECDEAMYFYWLEVLPPVWLNRPLEVEGHGTVSTFGFAEGREPVVAFWRGRGDGAGRFFGRQTDTLNTEGRGFSLARKE
jgi:hypothetical protein